MSQTITLPRTGRSSTPTTTDLTMTRTLLAGGAIAGPLFIATAIVQAVTRVGFDPRRHPISLLSLGDWGWVQILNFVITGLLFIACAVGMRRALHPGRAGVWGPWLVGAFGVSLVAGGVFVADPALGFPPGTPEGMPAQFSWHGIAHAIAPMVGFLSLIVACFVLARRYAGLNQRGWAVTSTTIGAIVLFLSILPDTGTGFVPLLAATVLGFGWASAMAAHLRASLPTQASVSN
jgi:hypothetical protein